MDYSNVGLIVKYEIKRITRDWGFRLSAMVSVGLVVWLHIITQSNWFWTPWVAISLPTAVPYVNMYMAVYLQLLFTLLWAGNWNFRGKTEQSEEAITVYPFSNAAWAGGKIAGYLVVMAGLSLVWMLEALCVNLLLSDAPFAVCPYVFYYVTLFVPALLFTVGCAVWVKSVARNSAMSLLILIVFFYCLVAWGDRALHGVFCLQADTLPNMLSDVTGLAEGGAYALQRLMLCCLGVGLMFWTVAREQRLPNNPLSPGRRTVVGIVFLLAGCLSGGWFVTRYSKESSVREDLREAYVRYDGWPKMFVDRHDIVFRQEGGRYFAKSEMALVNGSGQDVEEVLLYLNPGLTVSAVREGDGELDFERDRQAVLVRRGVGRGDTVRLALEYHGRICPEICYPEVTDLRTVAEYRRHYLFRQGRDYYYLRPDLTILTPECVWYPVSLPPVDVETPMLTQEYYTDFSLSVTGGEGRTVLSQGRMSQKGDTVRFENGQRLPGITLCMGPYTRMARRHGKVLYELYVLKGHEFLVEDKGDPTSLMEFWEKGMQGEYDFPYSKLSVVEAPLHFCAYARQWKSRSEFVQPEILFRPEKEAVTFGPQSTRSASGGEITSLYGWFESYDWLTLRRERGIYNGNFFQDKFAGHYPNPDMRPNEYYPHAIRTPYQIWMYSSSFPGIHLLMDEAMNGLTSDLGEMERSFRCGITDVASILSMRGHSLKEIVNAPSFANVIKLKTKLLFSRLHKVATFQELRTFWEEFYERHNFQAVGYEDFCLEFQRRFGYDLLAITEQMYAEKGLPWFEFKDARVDYMEDMDGEKVYLQQVKVWNRGDVEGVLKICSGGMKDSNYVIPAGASVEIRRVSKNSYAPEQWELQTILAQNIPSVIELNTPPRKVGSLDLREGMFLIDPGEFAEEEGTRVVDDTDEGFCLYSSSGQAMDIPQLQRGRQFPAYEAASSSWGSYYNSQAYGSPVRRYMSKECGNGNVCAVWEWKEAEAGMYEVFVFNNNFAPDDHEPFCVDGEQNGMRGKSRTPVQCYTIAHSDGEETVEVETFNAGFGWVSLGVYFIEHGEAKVTLSDKGAYPHQMIYADAVKWVRL